MAKSTKGTRARQAVGSAADNPYLRRLIEDEELRDSVRDAFEAARDAYARLSSNGNVIDTAIDDKKLHKNLKETAENLGLAFRRTPTPGTHPSFVSGLVDIVEERLGTREGRAAVGCFDAWYDVCRPNCCVKVMRDGTQRPTVAAVDSEVGVPSA